MSNTLIYTKEGPGGKVLLGEESVTYARQLAFTLYCPRVYLLT